MNMGNGAVADHDTCARHTVKCLVALGNSNYSHVSVMEGSLLHEDKVRSVWATNDGSIVHEDFTKRPRTVCRRQDKHQSVRNRNRPYTGGDKTNIKVYVIVLGPTPEATRQTSKCT